MPETRGTAVWALTAPAAAAARRLAAALPGARLCLPERLADPTAGEAPFGRFAPALEARFRRHDGHVCFCAAGIVVRALTGLAAHKTTDPAVVVCDPAGRFAVSLLGGHLGGANALARRVAAVLGGQAVITTATDAAGLPSLELLAAERGWPVENLGALAAVSRELVEGRAVAVADPGGWLLPELLDGWPGAFRPAGEGEAAPVYVGWAEPAPAGALVLRPPALALGVGCNRGTEPAELAGLADRVLAEAGLARAAVGAVASVDAKRDEPAVLALAAALGATIIFYDSHRLAGVSVPNPSATVARHMGSGSVCEAAAILAARGGALLAPKTKSVNATAAVALAAACGWWAWGPAVPKG